MRVGRGDGGGRGGEGEGEGEGEEEEEGESECGLGVSVCRRCEIKLEDHGRKRSEGGHVSTTVHGLYMTRKQKGGLPGLREGGTRWSMRRNEEQERSTMAYV